MSRFVVGIDLGTTNSAVGYVDTDRLSPAETAADRDARASDWQVCTLKIPQLIAPGQVESRETLPSFCYQAADTEFSTAALLLPWDESGARRFAGVLARDHGVQLPGRLVASAKSWLCHAGVDRTAAILPWQSDEDVQRLSPVEVSSFYLRHIVAAWNHKFPDHPLAEQTVVLTIPASFDEIARNLTIQAAQKSGLPRVLLIEEPQAAFYAWIDRHRGDWETLVTPGQKILICDIGGGTTDFTLIRVRSDGDGNVVFHRVAVGEHLILGGDNLDLALAASIEQRLRKEQSVELNPRQWSVLVRTCRHVKETLLSEHPPEELTVNLPGSGSRLIGAGLQTTVTREEVTALLVDGFLPQTTFSDVPQQVGSGFREFGLPYAADSAITRYLAHFLRSHAEAASDNTMLNDDAHPARPDILLFNGGLFESPVLRQRLIDCVTSWFPSADNWRPHVLESARLDLAVAHGAACYGMVSRGVGIRISAGLPRTYYIGVQSESGPTAVCLVPAGTEPGAEVPTLEDVFRLQTNSPVEFPVFYSGRRLTDAVGTRVKPDGEQLTALPPIRTVIQSSRPGKQSNDDATVNSAETAIRINARITEIGTLDLWCTATDSDRRWKLQFDVRSAVRTDVKAWQTSRADAEGVVDEQKLTAVSGILQAVFEQATIKPGGLAGRIAAAIDLSKDHWPTSLLRETWRLLQEMSEGRRRSPAHEAAWLNLTGFCLRPGFGYALDDWRVETTWNTLNGRLVHSTPEVRTQWWILWRRIAGGLSDGQQNALASPLLSSIRQTAQQMSTGRGRSGVIKLHDQDAAEVWRVLGAFEQLPTPVRRELGDLILQFLERPKMRSVREPLIWALGRLGSRTAINGNAQSIVDAVTATRWLEKMMSACTEESRSLPLAIAQTAQRTNDRFVDLPGDVRTEAVRVLRESTAPNRLLRLVEAGAADAETQAEVFGESLPLGLSFSR
ncbi:MAG: Hsp70 family protein [Planctomycetaceae bacterium]|nr:Hsp70 family protein [Planctomycetaceae bacterium]